MVKVNFKNKPKSKFRLSSKIGAGFTLVETLVYIAIVSIVLLLASSFVFYFIQSNTQTRGDREVLENARRALEIITYEINGAKGVYTPTTVSNQLSLETSKYLPTDEITNYIDFFICGSRICFKKEAQNPIYITSDTVTINNLAFNRISTNGADSIKINLIMRSNDTINGIQPSVNLTSTASPRSY